MDGVEASRTISGTLLEERPIIVAMTAYAIEMDENLCFDAGMHDYIHKPFTPERMQVRPCPPPPHPPHPREQACLQKWKPEIAHRNTPQRHRRKMSVSFLTASAIAAATAKVVALVVDDQEVPRRLMTSMLGRVPGLEHYEAVSSEECFTALGVSNASPNPGGSNLSTAGSANVSNTADNAVYFDDNSESLSSIHPNNDRLVDANFNENLSILVDASNVSDVDSRSISIADTQTFVEPMVASSSSDGDGDGDGDGEAAGAASPVPGSHRGSLKSTHSASVTDESLPDYASMHLDDTSASHAMDSLASASPRSKSIQTSPETTSRNSVHESGSLKKLRGSFANRSSASSGGVVKRNNFTSPSPSSSLPRRPRPPGGHGRSMSVGQVKDAIPNLILINVDLKDKTGLTMPVKIRTHFSGNDECPYLVAIAGYDKIDTLQQFDYVLQKPVSVQELKAMLRTFKKSRTDKTLKRADSTR